MMELCRRLFFTRDDDLDLLQVFFLAWIMFTGYAIVQVGLGEWSLPTAAWTTIVSVFATLAIAGTPTWIAKLLADSRMGAEQARAVASSVPSIYKDDER